MRYYYMRYFIVLKNCLDKKCSIFTSECTTIKDALDIALQFTNHRNIILSSGLLKLSKRRWLGAIYESLGHRDKFDAKLNYRFCKKVEVFNLDETVNISCLR